jgi:TetR/AcrR family transcriptional regulator, transcriptional repressor for nem operon
MADTRDQILTTAFKLFFEKGYKEVTMNQLVSASGLSKGAFYHYFSSKEELYKVTLDRYIDSYMENFTLDFDEQLTLKENLIRLFGRFAYITTELKESLHKKEFGMANYLLFLQEAMKKNDFKEKIARYNARFYSELAIWIDIAKKRNEIDPPLDSHILAKHLTSLMKGMTVLYSFGQGIEPLAETFNQIINQFFSYIERNNRKNSWDDIKE